MKSQDTAGAGSQNAAGVGRQKIPNRRVPDMYFSNGVKIPRLRDCDIPEELREYSKQFFERCSNDYWLFTDCDCKACGRGERNTGLPGTQTTHLSICVQLGHCAHGLNVYNGWKRKPVPNTLLDSCSIVEISLF